MAFKVDESAKYARTHEWVKVEGKFAVVGVSDYAQDKLSDVVFVELPAAGKEVAREKQLLVIESVKAAEDVFSPVSGAVTASNEKLVKTPELVNKDCYGDGWLVRIAMSDPGELDSLMDAKAYKEFLDTL
jgi:glycine cleavage system H protein